MENSQYQFSLNKYEFPPKSLSSISHLEKVSNERICLYKIMEEAKFRSLRPHSRKWNSFMASRIKEKKLHTYDILLKESNCVGQAQARLDDHIAHWMMSLCYCRTYELRLCFIRWELQWVALLYRRIPRDHLKEFLVQNDFEYAPVSCEEKESLKDKLMSCRNLIDSKFEDVSYFKGYFTEISKLVASRNVFISKGIAYFPECDIIYCIMNRLRAQFSIRLQWTKRMLPSVERDDRVNFVLQNVLIFNPVEYLPYPTDDINLENIDEIANYHYPLCMKTIHNALRTNHHLKYDSKMQYGIFLKWIGLSFEDAMEFWEKEFTQSMSTNLYHQKYAYLFKHQYGMVGGRIQYKPYTCEEIQNYSPLQGQYHGCPFKHWDKEILLKKLHSDGLQIYDINSIEELVAKEKYKDACTKYFCAKYQVFRDGIIQSPNQYASESFHYDKDIDSVLNLICDDLS